MSSSRINWKLVAVGVVIALVIILTSCANQPPGGDLYKSLAYLKH